MNITNKNIDGGKTFDWGRTSSDYAKFRDIYPQEFSYLLNSAVSGNQKVSLTELSVYL